MTLIIVAASSLGFGIWWGMRWADWSTRVDAFLKEQSRW